MTKTAYEKQSTRLAALKCPEHGYDMKHEMEAGAPAASLHVFTCPAKHCKIRGTAALASGRILLDPEFAFLVDPTIGQLPTQTYNQERGLRAADIASVALSRIAFVHRVETGSDIGIDFICELRARRNPTGHMFNVQCKALPAYFDRNEDTFSLQIKVSTARYWLEQTAPTILVVVDPDNGKLYWQDPVEVLTKLGSDWRSQGDVSIPIFKSSEFDCFSTPPQALMDKVRQGSARIGNALRERLYTIENIIDKEIEAGVNRKSRDVTDLLLAEHSPVVEAFKAIESILTFQDAIYKKVVHMVADISSVAAKFHEDSFRKLYGIKDESGNYATDEAFIEERTMFDAAHLFASKATSLTASEQLKQAIQHLVDLEFLHEQSRSYEIEYEMLFDRKERQYNVGDDI